MRLSMAEQLAQATGRPVPKVPEPQAPKPKQHHAGSSKLSSLETLTSLYMLGQAFSSKMVPVRLEATTAAKAAQNLRVEFNAFRTAAREVGAIVVASTPMSVEQIILCCHHLGIEIRHMTKEDAKA